MRQSDWSNELVGHLEIHSHLLSESMFDRTFYYRISYGMSMNDVPNDVGNFIMGTDGFRQMVMYGYAGSLMILVWCIDRIRRCVIHAQKSYLKDILKMVIKSSHRHSCEAWQW